MTVDTSLSEIRCECSRKVSNGVMEGVAITLHYLLPCTLLQSFLCLVCCSLFFQYFSHVKFLVQCPSINHIQVIGNFVGEKCLFEYEQNLDHISVYIQGFVVQ